MAEPRPDFYEALPSPANPPAQLPDGLCSDDESGAARARYEKELDGWLEAWKQRAADSAKEIAVSQAREDADVAAEAALLKGIHDAYIATSQSSLDRALTRMNVVTGSVAAITTIYTGLLGLVYASESGKGRQLTLVAVMPALFLGLSLFLVAIYAAMFRRKMAVLALLPTGLGGQIAETRLITFMTWCFGGVWARSWALHAGIVSLGIGVATLPLPFVQAPGGLELAIFLVGILSVTGTAAFSSARSKNMAWANNLARSLDSKLPF
jgi:hypothetical protein